MVVALALALTVGESFEEAPEESVSSKKRICRIPNKSASYVRIDIDQSAVECVPILDQVVKDIGGNAR